MTKIDIFSGFLGAGKTTLIKKLIAEAYSGEKLVLIENEFGEIAVDGGFLKDAGVEITEMNSGCICCSLVGDFNEALKKVIDQFHPDRILIEPSGVGKLSDVIKAVQGVTSDDVVLNSFTTVADASKIRMYTRNFGEFFNNQIENAACIILSRTADMSEQKLLVARTLVKDKNHDAEIITTPWDQLTGKEILDAIERKSTLKDELAEMLAEADDTCPVCGHHHDHDHEHHHDHNHDHDDECGCGHDHHHHDHDEHHHDHDDECGCGHDHHHHDHDGHDHHHHHADDVFTSWGDETARKYSEEELNTMLNALGDKAKYGMILRAKGFIDSADGGEWIYFDYTPGEINIRRGSAGVAGRICVIGSKIDESALKELFCLA